MNSLKIIRERKKLSLSQLAAKASIPIHLLVEYDEGRKPIPQSHLRMLAKALWVTAEEIEAAPLPPVRRPSEPVSKPAAEMELARGPSGGTGVPSGGLVTSPAPAGGWLPSSTEGATPEVRERSRTAESKAKARSSAPPSLITDGQVNEIGRLGGILGIDENAIAARLGKPPVELSRMEARQFIGLLRREIVDKGLSLRSQKSIRESPDFEPRFLEEQLREASTLAFTMFDGQKFSGVISGFDPYTITIKDSNTGEEIVLRKLAMMYYKKVKG